MLEVFDEKPLAGALPHFFWHYVDGGAVLAQSDEVARAWRGTAEKLIGFLEQGVIPTDADLW